MTDLAIAPDSVPSGLIVTARSYLVDRFLADFEIIARPEKRLNGGTLSWRTGHIEAVPPPSGKSGKLRGMLPVPRRSKLAPDGRWIFDLRGQNPENWAHFLNNHVPLAFAVSGDAGLDLAEALVLLPKDVPRYIRDAAAFFGLEVLATNDLVTGHGLEIKVTPWTALRAIRHRWVRLPGLRAVLAGLEAVLPDRPLPRKVYLSRRDTRTVVNSAEIEALLSARGFETVYPETLSVADQFRLFFGAEEMVAVHSAGLAPLLYCEPGRGPRRLVEIMPCGHMTDVYRTMAAQVGCRWIGVRGRIKPEYVRPAYTLEKPFKAYSLDNFEVDPASIDEALRILDDETREASG